MNKNRPYIILGVVLLTLILSCNLPFSTGNLTPATPNHTMTAIYALATLLTPDFSKEIIITATPLPPPTQTNTPVPDTETPLPTQTNTSTSLPPSSTPTLFPPTATYVPITPLAPTNTIIVPTINPQRPGGLFGAAYLKIPPVLDGIWDEWNTTAFPAGYIVFGAANYSGPDDLDAAFRVGWDQQYLYIAVKVKDDVYAQNASGQDIYKGDSIEIQVDTDLYGDFQVTQVSSDDYQLGISPGRPDTNGFREAVLWLPREGNGSRPQVSISSTSGAGVYRLEAAIPWSVLNTQPAAGKHMGFTLSVSDNDDLTQNVQQSMVSSSITRKLLNPTTWGEIILNP